MEENACEVHESEPNERNQHGAHGKHIELSDYLEYLLHIPGVIAVKHLKWDVEAIMVSSYPMSVTTQTISSHVKNL